MDLTGVPGPTEDRDLSLGCKLSEHVSVWTGQHGCSLVKQDLILGRPAVIDPVGRHVANNYNPFIRMLSFTGTRSVWNEQAHREQSR